MVLYNTTDQCARLGQLQALFTARALQILLNDAQRCMRINNGDVPLGSQI